MTDNPVVAKRVTIEELFKINGHVLPPITVPSIEDVVYHDSVEDVYNNIYAPALDKFLETRWYTMLGLDAMRSDSKLLAEFGTFVRATSAPLEEPSRPNLLAHETRLIWNLLNMCCKGDAISVDLDDPGGNAVVSTDGGSGISTYPSTQGQSFTFGGTSHAPYHLPPTGTTSLPLEHPNAYTPSARLRALIALLTSSPPASQLTNEPTIPPSTPFDAHTSYPHLSQLTHQLHAREDEFWFYVGRYVDAADGDDAQRETALARTRALLDGLENRDLVWTVMRVRSLERRAQGSQATGLKEGVKERESETSKDVADEKDPKKERAFVMNVLKNEAGLAEGGDGVTSGTGKNVVAMRIAAMALRAFESNE